MTWILYSGIASIIGLWLSLYVTLLFYRKIPHTAKWMLPFLRMPDESTCDSVIRGEYGVVFKLPNALLGIFYYIFMGYVSFSVLNRGGTLYVLTYTVLSLLVALFSLFLLWSLLFKIKRTCKICYTANTLNIFIFVCWLLFLLEMQCPACGSRIEEVDLGYALMSRAKELDADIEVVSATEETFEEKDSIGAYLRAPLKSRS